MCSPVSYQSPSSSCSTRHQQSISSFHSCLHACASKCASKHVCARQAPCCPASDSVLSATAARGTCSAQPRVVLLHTCHAATLPPSTSRASSTIGMWPASLRYLAVDRPARPAPAITTRSGRSGRGAALSSAMRCVGSSRQHGTIKWPSVQGKNVAVGESQVLLCTVRCCAGLVSCACHGFRLRGDRWRPRCRKRTCRQRRSVQKPRGVVQRWPREVVAPHLRYHRPCYQSCEQHQGTKCKAPAVTAACPGGFLKRRACSADRPDASHRPLLAHLNGCRCVRQCGLMPCVLQCRCTWAELVPPAAATGAVRLMLTSLWVTSRPLLSGSSKSLPTGPSA